MNIRASTYYNQIEKFVQAFRYGFRFEENLEKGIGVINEFIRSQTNLNNNKRLPSKESKQLQDELFGQPYYQKIISSGNNAPNKNNAFSNNFINSGNPNNSNKSN